MLSDGAEEAVFVQGVEDFLFAHAIAPARLGQKVGDVRGALHSAGDDDFGVAEAGAVGSQHDGAQAGTAADVHGERGNGAGDAGAVHGDTGRVGADAGLPAGAEDHLVDVLAFDAGTLNGRFECDSAQFGAAQLGKRAAEFSPGRTRCADNNGVAHFISPPPFLTLPCLSSA